MNLFEQLQDELFYIMEAKGQRIPERFSDFLNSIMRRDPYIARLLMPPNTTYEEIPCSPSFNTAGVRPIDTRRIAFVYCKKFLDEDLKDEASINFLLKHEILHIILGHYERGASAGITAKTHRMFNIAADVVINEKCKSEPGIGGRPIKVIQGAWLKDKTEGYNSLEEAFGEKYTGDMQAEAIYDWMMEKYEEQKDKDSDKGEGDGEDQENQAAQIGDIIKTPDGKMGKVLAKNGNRITKIKSMTWAEIKSELSGKK
jgi:hypothetical protein